MRFLFLFLFQKDLTVNNMNPHCIFSTQSWSAGKQSVMLHSWSTDPTIYNPSCSILDLLILQYTIRHAPFQSTDLTIYNPSCSILVLYSWSTAPLNTIQLTAIATVLWYQTLAFLYFKLKLINFSFRSFKFFNSFGLSAKESN